MRSWRIRGCLETILLVGNDGVVNVLNTEGTWIGHKWVWQKKWPKNKYKWNKYKTQKNLWQLLLSRIMHLHGQPSASVGQSIERRILANNSQRIARVSSTVFFFFFSLKSFSFVNYYLSNCRILYYYISFFLFRSRAVVISLARNARNARTTPRCFHRTC